MISTQHQRVLRDVGVERAEFGFLPFIGSAVASLIGPVAGVYGQIKTAESQEKAAKAQAEAAVKVAQARAAQSAETMRRLAPILGFVVIGGTLVTVILIKKKKKGGRA